jgi:hypothetical protein
VEHESGNTVEEMRKDLQGWGFGLIIVGIASLIFHNFLDPVWGVIIIIIGIITLAVQSRGMYIVIGISLIIVGLLNMLGGGGWFAFGIVQIVIGITELIKYGKYADAQYY